MAANPDAADSAAAANPDAAVSAVAANPDATVSAMPATFSQQHWPSPPLVTSYQQQQSTPTFSGGVLGATPWSWWAMWSNKPSAFQRVGAMVTPMKKLTCGIQGANSTEKSPFFCMRVDSDDGISDDECGSAMAPGSSRNRKRNQITCPLSKQPKKKPKHEEPPKHTISLNKMKEFLATWRDPCLQSPDDSEMILGSMLDSYADTLTSNQRKRMKTCFTQYPAIALLNVAVRTMGDPSFRLSLEPTVPVRMDARPGCSNEGSNKPPDSSLSLSLSNI